METRESAAARRGEVWFLAVGVAALLLSSLPYLWAWWNTPAGHVYTGLLHNIDDGAVYRAWMRQVADGRFFQENWFSVEPQRSVLFNVWFLVLGNIAKWVGLVAADHLGRVVGGALLLWGLHRLIHLTVPEGRARRLAFLLACFGSGLGWLWGGYDPARGFDKQPIDLFQPEAVTFLSLHYSPLFAPATAAMVWFVVSLLSADRSGRWRDLVPAMACMALLGNFHSYDIVSLLATTGLFVVSGSVLQKRFDKATWLRGAVLVACAVPTAGWVWWASKVDPLFHARSLTQTWTAPVWFVLLGLGLPSLLAPAGALRKDAGADGRRLLVCWAIACLCVAYLPVEFQRKMLMGIHVPVAILGGMGLDALVRRLPGGFPGIAAALGVCATLPSPLLFVSTELLRLESNVGSTQYRPYLRTDEAAALAWLSENARRGDHAVASPDPTSHLRFPFVAAMPHLAVWLPSMGGVKADNGHWSETLDYPRKLSRGTKIFSARITEPERESLLREAGIRWLVYDRRLAQGPLVDATGVVILDPASGAPLYEPVDWVTALPPMLAVRYSNASVMVLEVLPGEGTRGG